MKKKSVLIMYSLVTLFLFTSASSEAKGSKKEVSGKININTASAKQIDQLPGISPQKANAIVEYRKDHPFHSVGDLDQIKGFSPKSIEKIRPYVSTEGENSFKNSTKNSVSRKNKKR